MTVGEVEFVSQIWWYTSRSAGILAWVLLSVSVVAGLALSSRGTRVLPAGWVLDLHRFTSTLSLLFLTIHLVALVPDNFIHFAWAELFVPMASEWKPGAVAWGIVAFWLVVCVEITSLVRGRIPHRVWRVVHFASFAVWVSATIHLFLAGTDASHPVFRSVQAVVITAVVVLFARRVWRARRSTSSLVADSDDGGSALPVEEPVDVDQVHSREGAELAVAGGERGEDVTSLGR